MRALYFDVNWYKIIEFDDGRQGKGSPSLIQVQILQFLIEVIVHEEVLVDRARVGVGGTVGGWGGGGGATAVGEGWGGQPVVQGLCAASVRLKIEQNEN